MPSSRGPSQTSDQTHVYCISCIASDSLSTQQPGKWFRVILFQIFAQSPDESLHPHPPSQAVFPVLFSLSLQT